MSHPTSRTPGRSALSTTAYVVCLLGGLILQDVAIGLIYVPAFAAASVWAGPVYGLGLVLTGAALLLHLARLIDEGPK